MRRGLLGLLVLLSLVLAPTAAFAQDQPVPLPVACGSLGEEDCTILKESALAMQGLEFYTAATDMNLSLRNLPNLPADLTTSITVDGSFHLNPELMAQMAALQFTDQSDMEVALNEMLNLVIDFYFETGFDMNIDLGISSDIQDYVSQMAGIAVPDALHLPVRMVDGFIYVNLDDLEGKFEGTEGINGWIGIDYGTLISEGISQAMAEMENGTSGAGAMSSTMMSSIGVQMNKDLRDAVLAYTEVERLDDVDVDGVAAAQFRSTFDLAGFVSDPAFIDLAVQQIKMQMEMQAAMGQEVPPVTDADIQMVTDMLPMFAPMLLSGLEFDTVRTIGLDDLYVRDSETTLSWDLGTVMTMVAAMQQGGAPARPQRGADGPTFDFSTVTRMSGFGEEVEIEAPADAQIIPLEQLQSSETM